MTKSKPIVLNIDTTTLTSTTTILEPVKGKRGRKSKKELMAALNMDLEPIPINTNTNTNTENVTFSVTEIEIETEAEEDFGEGQDLMSNIVIISNPHITEEVKHVMKKRGRKPKGGKIIQQVIPTENQTNDKPNVILHLKCSMKDLQNSANSTNVDSYTFGSKNELCYDVIGGENINSINTYYNEINSVKNVKTIKNTASCFNDDDDDDCNTNKDATKEIWKKLKQLEHNLHINNVNNKKSACFWDSCDFDNPPVYIPKHFINGTYHVYGCFCSPECGVAYLMNENIDSSTKFERYHLFNHIYSKIYDYKKNIKPSPNPHYMLEKFYGNLSIQEYRSLLRNERLFIIVDKPLTRILPELHDDNDEFILNNTIIPSNNNYQLKSRMQKKKPNKNSILNEKFGMPPPSENAIKMICNDELACDL